MAWITGCHHVLGIENLLGQLRNSEGTVLLATTRCQWSKAGHEEMQTWEWNHVHGQFTQVRIQLYTISTLAYQHNRIKNANALI